MSKRSVPLYYSHNEQKVHSPILLIQWAKGPFLYTTHTMGKRSVPIYYSHNGQKVRSPIILTQWTKSPFPYTTHTMGKRSVPIYYSYTEQKVLSSTLLTQCKGKIYIYSLPLHTLYIHYKYDIYDIKANCWDIYPQPKSHSLKFAGHFRKYLLA